MVLRAVPQPSSLIVMGDFGESRVKTRDSRLGRRESSMLWRILPSVS